jgi:molybdenum cofactor cytidylyltransferase
MATSSLHAILLAAGASSRFGSPKQLARVQQVPMLSLMISRAQAVAGRAVSVVLGANAAQIAPSLARTDAAVVINRGWAEGLASSIRAGVEHLPGHCEGALLLLADQCAVTAADLQRLVIVWNQDPLAIVAAQYAGGWGVPAIFPRTSFPALLALRGDQGARALLRRPAGRRIGVPLANAAIDVDTVKDLQALATAVPGEP